MKDDLFEQEINDTMSRLERHWGYMYFTSEHCFFSKITQNVINLSHKIISPVRDTTAIIKSICY